MSESSFQESPVLDYEGLVRQNHYLANAVNRLEKKIERLERRLEAEESGGMEVTCVFCERDVSESRAVSPAGQGIWFCNVCDDELTRDRARYLIKEAAGD